MSQAPSTPQPKPVRKTLRRMVWLLVGSSGVVLVLLSVFENSLVYHPQKYPAGNWTLPDSTIEDVHFKSADGTDLHGWYFPHPNPRGFVLFSHGNGGNVAGWSHAAITLRDRQRLSVFLYDYRGYGQSAGSPNEAGILQDARAARGWLAQRAHIQEQDILQFGQSLGGAVAVDLAAADGARGLIVARTFSSIRDVAARNFPWIPVRLIMRHKLDSLSKVAEYHGPTLLCHGDADPVVPIEFGRKLFERANEPKRFVLESGGGHNGPLSEEFHRALDEYLTTLIPVAK